MLDDTAFHADEDAHLNAGGLLRVRYEREPRTLMPEIRKMLRQRPVMSRAEIRSDLRARGRIGQCGHGGRRLYEALHRMADRGEIRLEPDMVFAVNLARPGRERPRPEARPLGPRLSRREAAVKREKRLAKRQERVGS